MTKTTLYKKLTTNALRIAYCVLRIAYCVFRLLSGMDATFRKISQ